MCPHSPTHQPLTHAQVQRRHVHLVLDRDALGVLEVGQRRLDELGEEIADVLH
jgi:hypothetical protein